jgi:NAD(P)H-hydrate epimerase
LHNIGTQVIVFITSKKSEIKNDAEINLKIIEKINIETVEIMSQDEVLRLKKKLATCDVVIDGIFGTGFKGQISGIIGEIAEHVNICSKYVIAIDIPSGVNGETGEVLGKCIRLIKL